VPVATRQFRRCTRARARPIQNPMRNRRYTKAVKARFRMCSSMMAKAKRAALYVRVRPPHSFLVSTALALRCPLKGSIRKLYLVCGWANNRPIWPVRRATQLLSKAASCPARKTATIAMTDTRKRPSPSGNACARCSDSRGVECFKSCKLIMGSGEATHAPAIAYLRTSSASNVGADKGSSARQLPALLITMPSSSSVSIATPT